jgi:hypothetical protein
VPISVVAGLGWFIFHACKMFLLCGPSSGFPYSAVSSFLIAFLRERECRNGNWILHGELADRMREVLRLTAGSLTVTAGSLKPEVA